MRFVVQAFYLPKEGNSPEEYEDAFYPRGPLDDRQAGIRLAVADGATETSFSGLWASLLARSYVDAQIGDGEFRAELRPLRISWREQVGEKPLPWYAEEKLKSGAFATLAGLNIMTGGPDGGAWDAIAVGDSSIFQIRDNDVLVKFPIEHSEQFTSRPALICSNTDMASEVKESRASGLWQAGDTFFLMTDAVACNFLKRWERISLPDNADDPADFLRLFRDLDSEEEFSKQIAEARTDRWPDGTPLMRNDDVTFLRCTILSQ